MKRSGKILLTISGVVVLIFCALTLLLATPNYLSIAYHNACLQEARTSSKEVHIKCKAFISPGHVTKEISITKKDEIIWLINRLTVPQSISFFKNAHLCHGHLAISIRTIKGDFLLSYDHGDGIYPIARDGDSPSFINLDPAICSELNTYFQSLGFTKEELGLH